MRRILITLIVCFYILPTFAYTVDITTLGAKGDGITDNTAFIQKAKDDCSARKGGTVEIPSGHFLTRTLFLKSNVNLHLHFGAELLVSTDLDSYHKVFPELKGKESPALIFARGVANIAITGSGTINGQGAHQNFQHGNDSKGGPRKSFTLSVVIMFGCKMLLCAIRLIGHRTMRSATVLLYVG